jgi:hypothetical protein
MGDLKVAGRVGRHLQESLRLSNCRWIQDRHRVTVGIEPFQPCPHLPKQILPLRHLDPPLCHGAYFADAPFSDAIIRLLHELAEPISSRWSSG